MHTATLLTDGTVLVAGGKDQVGTTLAKTAVFTPGLGTWSTTTPPMGTARFGHTATRLQNGTVLVVGGMDNQQNLLTSAEIYTPGGGWTSVPNSMNTPRTSHTATLLPDGTVLVAGGTMDWQGNTTTAEVYDPVQGTWTYTAAAGNQTYLFDDRCQHTATLLPNGTVLVAGGRRYGGTSLASSELYDPATGIWNLTMNAGQQTLMASARDSHTATLLPDGTVLVAGGEEPDNNYQDLAGAELYHPTTGTWTVVGALNVPRTLHTATLLPNGKVLVAGGAISTGTEVFTPATGLWTPTGWLELGRSSHTATLLLDGTVMVAFGVGGDVATEIYMP
jgi:hypothetical protein